MEQREQEANGTSEETGLTVERLNTLPATKEGISVFVERVRQELDSGKIEPLKLKCTLKALELLIKQVDEVTKPFALTEAEKYGKGPFTFMGAEFQVKEVGARYNYDKCGDPIYAKLATDLKARETFLKGIKDHETIVDESTGETVTVYPPVKTSTTSVTVTLK